MPKPSPKQIEIIRKEITYWTNEGDEYARGKASGLHNALVLLGVEEEA